MATMFTPKVTCRSEYLYSAFRIFSGSASFLTSITARMPMRSDSSRMSWMPENRPFFSSLTRRIFSSMAALLTWYGTSSTTISLRPALPSSMCTFARTFSLPRPVS